MRGNYSLGGRGNMNNDLTREDGSERQAEGSAVIFVTTATNTHGFQPDTPLIQSTLLTINYIKLKPRRNKASTA